MTSIILIPKQLIMWLLPLLLSLTACQQTPDAANLTQTSTVPTMAEAMERSIAQGEYLVRLGGCNDCHTPGYPESAGKMPKSEWLQGSPVGHHGPWGTAYPTNLRLSIDKLSEQDWMIYSANLRTRPLMPDFMLRDMSDADRRDIYRFIKSLGPAGQSAPEGLPPGVKPSAPYLEMVLPPPDTGSAHTG